MVEKGGTGVPLTTQAPIPAGEGRPRRPTGGGRDVVDAISALVAVVDGDGRIVSVNRAWTEQWAVQGRDPSVISTGRPYLSIGMFGDGADLTTLAAGLQGAMAGRGEFQHDFASVHDGETMWWSVRIAARQDGPGAVLTHIDITERHRAVDVLQAQTAVLELIASGATLPACLREVALSIEELSPAARCAIMVMSDGGQLRIGAAPNLPPVFAAVIDGISPGPAAGAWGTAVHEGRTVVCADIATDPTWEDYRGFALGDGLRACWSVPIVSDGGGTPLGAFALFYDLVRSPTSAELRLVHLWSQLAGFAIERDRRISLLARSEARTAAVLNAAADGIVVVATDGRVRSANPAAGILFGQASTELVDAQVADLLSFDGTDPAGPLRPTGARRRVSGRPADAIGRDGRRFPVEVSLSEHDLAGDWLTTVTIRDVTERRAFEARLAHQASHDALTGLPNRFAVVEGIGEALAAGGGHPVVVLCLDLDRFKVVNDSLGHHNGDRLLAVIATRLADALPGHLVGRLGGDEFVVVCSGDAIDTSAVCDLVLRVVGEPVDVAGRRLTSSTSIGVATSTGGGDTAERLLLDADVALYQAKAEGGAKACVFDDALRGRAMRRLEMEGALRTALEVDGFRLAYQPLVRLADGAVVGAEALLRFDHPGVGPVEPAEFVPVAEEIGLIEPLGRWVIVTALTEADRWRRALGRTLAISVNVSARQVEQPGLVDDVVRALEATGLAPGALCLEITETNLLRDRSLPVLRRLKALGLRIALDDFGVGLSSLDYLRRFPLADQLKIDRSFTEDLGRSAESVAIAGAIVALAHSLGMESVGEGIERREQYDALGTLGCDLAQGFFTGEPMTGAQLVALLAGPESSR